MTLRWSPGTPRGREQRVAVTTRKEGFSTNNYGATGSLSPNQSSHVLSDVQPGGIYYWQVLTLQGDTWVHSDTASFTGPTCVPGPPP